MRSRRAANLVVVQHRVSRWDHEWISALSHHLADRRAPGGRAVAAGSTHPHRCTVLSLIPNPREPLARLHGAIRVSRHWQGPNAVAEVLARPINVLEVIVVVRDAADVGRRPAQAAPAVAAIVESLPVLGEVDAVIEPVARLGQGLENEALRQVDIEIAAHLEIEAGRDMSRQVSALIRGIWRTWTYAGVRKVRFPDAC